jgi:hypothetical protein
MLWWCYSLAFVGGSIVGIIVMGLMAASRVSEPHEVHVYCDEHGNLEIMTLPPGDVIIWHKDVEELQQSIRRR